MLLPVVGNELIHSIGEPDHFRSHVVDEHGAINAAGIEKLEESFGRAAELDNLIEVGLLFLHQLQRLGLEHFHGLDVDVAVGDHSLGRLVTLEPSPEEYQRNQFSAAASTARLVKTPILSRRYSGVTSRSSQRLRTSPLNLRAASAHRSSTALPRSNSPTPALTGARDLPRGCRSLHRRPDRWIALSDLAKKTTTKSQEPLIRRHFFIHTPRPGIDATSHGLSLFKSLLPQPHGHIHRANAVMANHYNRVVGIEFLVRPRRHIAHGHQLRAIDARRLKLPGLAHIEQSERVSRI